MYYNFNKMSFRKKSSFHYKFQINFPVFVPNGPNLNQTDFGTVLIQKQATLPMHDQKVSNNMFIINPDFLSRKKIKFHWQSFIRHFQIANHIEHIGIRRRQTLYITFNINSKQLKIRNLCLLAILTS